jgi:hypothetical protein
MLRSHIRHYWVVSSAFHQSVFSRYRLHDLVLSDIAKLRLVATTHQYWALESRC